MREKLAQLKWSVLNFVSSLSYIEIRCKNNNAIYFELHNNVFERYLYQLIKFYELSGYHVVFKLTYGFLGSWSTNLILKNVNNISFSLIKPAKSLLCFSDYPSDKFDYLLSSNYFNSPEDGFHIPMPMVDSLYINGAYKMAPGMSQNEKRSIGIFFAGNLVEKGYDREELKNFFGMPTRLQTIQYVRDTFSVHITKPASPEFWNKYNTNGSYEIILVDRKIANVEPLILCEVLANSSFFLSLPGVVMPFSHNLIEAMCFGSIPILNYAHLCHPKLEHGVNCLVYSDFKGLGNRIREALAMDAEQIKRMRRNVIAYYSDHLSVDAVVNNLDKNKRGHQVNCYLNAEYRSVIQMNSNNQISDL